MEPNHLAPSDQIQQNRDNPLISELWLNLGWIGCILLTFLELALLFILLPWMTPEPDLKNINQLFLYNRIADCLPEPLEHNRYIFGVITLFVFFVGLAKWIGTYAKTANLKPRSFQWLYVGTFLAQALLIGFCTWNWIVQVDASFVYFNSNQLWIAFIFSMAFLCSWGLTVNHTKRSLPQWLQWGSLSIAALYLICNLLSCLFTEENLAHAYGQVTNHIPFLMDEFASVLNGHTPLVDFFPQYQYLLSFLAVPYFKAFGFGIGSFTFLMLLLSFVAMTFVYFIFKRITQSLFWATLLYIPFLAASFFPIYEFSLIDHPEYLVERANAFNYYAVNPIRTFGPWCVAFAYLFYLSRKSWQRMFLLFLIASFSMVNNLDLGLPAFGAAFIGVVFSLEEGVFPLNRAVGQSIIISLSSLFIALFTFFATLFIRSGRFPEVIAWLNFQKAFVHYGFYMLPMPDFGLYWILFASFGAAVAIGILTLQFTQQSPHAKEFRLRMGMLLFSGVLGFGASAYYVGRSHPYVLTAIFSFWMFSNCLLLWELLLQWKQAIFSKNTIRSFIYILPIFLTLFTFFSFSTCVFDVVSFSDQFKRLSIRLHSFNFETHIITLVRYFNPENLPMMLIYPYGHKIALDIGIKNYYPFAHPDSLILKEQVNQVMNEVNRAGVRKIIGSFQKELQDSLSSAGFISKTLFSDDSQEGKRIKALGLQFWEK